MKKHFYNDLVLGILGGGQLGRMLIQSGMDFGISFAVLDSDPHAPCCTEAGFTIGKLTDYEAVMQFGAQCDVITIEIENVNVEALAELASRGIKVFPQPDVIALIQDKRIQKQFFADKNIPTSDFILTQNREEAMTHNAFLPAVHKLAREGYDGRGVQVMHHNDDLKNAFDAPGILEKWVDIQNEIAFIAVRSERGETVLYPAVEMIFHPNKNILEHVFAPARIPTNILQKAMEIARTLTEELQIIGALAVEMFISKTGEILVNEIAPRPHNSGHHTIEAYETSQYEQHLRAILNQPLGSIRPHSSGAMVNLLGGVGHEGEAVYKGLEEILSMEGAHVHLYGKKQTRPFRKMGHVTILDDDIKSLEAKVDIVKQRLNVIT